MSRPAVPRRGVRFIAETSLSRLSEAHVKRPRRNDFDALLPGIESWHDLGNKSNSGARTGGDKLRPVADQVNIEVGTTSLPRFYEYRIHKSFLKAP